MNATARPSRSPYEVLGLRPGAREEEIELAFRRHARLHHPDAGGDPARFMEGVEAARALRRGGQHHPAPANVTFRSTRRSRPVPGLLTRLRSFVHVPSQRGGPSR